MGKSSGGGGSPSGSQTIIQDIAEPFKSFATRSLERAERLQGLPGVPFTGIGQAGPTPDELVAAQALRQRFMEADPLTEQALGLQATAADPITAQSIEERRNPFDALIAQEAYRRLDERGQRERQDLRAQEVAAGGTDRSRGVIEASLQRQRQADQERRIGIESGQKSFTEASRLAQADRLARGDTSMGISKLLGERQALQRRDIDDLLKVGAQFREQFIQPGVDLERQQFVEERGPASVQNPFGFEQFFSGIRSAAPTPAIQTTQQFKQTPSGLSQIAPVVGAGIGVAGQFVREGGEINFDEGGIASFKRGEAVLTPVEKQKQIEARLKKFFDHIKDNPNAYEPEVMADLEAMRDEYIEQTTGGGAIASANYADRMEYYQSFLDGITNVTNPVAAKFLAGERPKSLRPLEEDYVSWQTGFSEDADKNLGGINLDSIEEWKRSTRLGRGDAPIGYRKPEGEVIPSADPAQPEKRISITTWNPGDSVNRANQASYRRQLAEREGADAKVLLPDPRKPMKYIPETTEGDAPPESRTEDEVVVDTSFVETEPEGPGYSNADITAMMTYEQSGRGQEALPRHLRGLDRWEMTQELKSIREGARKASEPRRKKERRERFSNRRNFNRQGGIGDTGSFDISDLFNFNKGGVASFSRGGGSDIFDVGGLWSKGDPFTNMVLDAVGMQDLKKYGQSAYMFGGMDDDPSKDPGGHGAWGEEEEDEISALQHIENYQETQRQAQRRRRIKRNKRLRRETETGLSSLNKGGIASFDKGGMPDFSEYGYGMGEEAMTRGSMLGGESLPLMHSYEPEGEAVSKKSALTQMEKLMALSAIMNRSAPRDQYYPDAPEMTSKQKGKMLMQAIAGALGAIKADPDTGLTDFSDVGRGAIQGMEGFKGKLEEGRASSIALERQQKQDFRQTMTDLQALETSIQSGNKTALEAQLLEFELAHPEYKAATQSMSDILRNLMPGAEFPIEQFKAAVNQMRILMGKQAGTAPQGLILPENILDSRVKQGQEKKVED